MLFYFFKLHFEQHLEQSLYIDTEHCVLDAMFKLEVNFEASV